MKLKSLLTVLCAVALSVAAVPAHATKTAPPLPIQLTVTPQTISPGGTVSYLMHLANKSSSSYWGVRVTVPFPEHVTCTAIVSANRKGCSLANNVLSCYWADYYDWWTTDVTVSCVEKHTTPCGGTVSATANLEVNKPAQVNASTATFTVACANPTATPTPQPTSTPVVFPTATPTSVPSTPIATATPVNTATPISTATPTNTSVPVVTATPTPTSTGTPVVTATPTATPTGDCQTYSVLRRVQGNYQRTLVAIKEAVRVLPDGNKLSCLQNILRETSAPCLTYSQVSLPAAPELQTQLRNDSAGGACFGMSQLTYSLLNIACTLDDQSDECEQFLALNLFRSNGLPQPHTAAGICLGREHNPRFQEIIIDRDCRIIFHPTHDQEANACPAAQVSTWLYSYGKNRKGKWWD